MFWTKPLFAAKNLVGFDCLIACAALGVQEAEEFLQGFGIRGIPEKSSFPSDPNQIFVPQLVQMMRGELVKRDLLKVRRKAFLGVA